MDTFREEFERKMGSSSSASSSTAASFQISLSCDDDNDDEEETIKPMLHPIHHASQSNNSQTRTAWKMPPVPEVGVETEVLKDFALCSSERVYVLGGRL